MGVLVGLEVVGVLLCWLALVGGRVPSPRVVHTRASGPWRRESNEVSRRLVVLLAGGGVVVLASPAVGSPVLAVLFPLLWCFGRREAGRHRDRLVSGRRADMALDLVVDAASGLRAGRSLAGSLLGDVSSSVGEANELRRLMAERVVAGRPFALAVDEVLGGGSVDERLIATTIQALDATGAPAGAALERVAEALGERRSSREDARTQAQHALSSAGVLAALPLVFGCAAALAEPDVGRLYVSTWLGAGCVGVAAVLIAGSWEWLQRLLQASR